MKLESLLHLQATAKQCGIPGDRWHLLECLSTCFELLVSCAKTICGRSKLLSCAVEFACALKQDGRDMEAHCIMSMSTVSSLAHEVTQDARSEENSKNAVMQYYKEYLAISVRLDAPHFALFEDLAGKWFDFHQILSCNAPDSARRLDIAFVLELYAEQFSSASEHELTLSLLDQAYSILQSSLDPSVTASKKDQIECIFRRILIMFVWSLPAVPNRIEDSLESLHELSTLEGPDSALVIFLSNHVYLHACDFVKAKGHLLALLKHKDATAEMCCSALKDSYRLFECNEAIQLLFERFDDDAQCLVEIAKVAVSSPYFAVDAILSCLNDDRLKDLLNDDKDASLSICSLLWNAACDLVKKNCHEIAIGFFFTVFHLKSFTVDFEVDESRVNEAIMYCIPFQKAASKYEGILKSRDVTSREQALLKYKALISNAEYNGAKALLQKFDLGLQGLRWTFVLAVQEKLVEPAFDVVEAIIAAASLARQNSDGLEAVIYLNMVKLASDSVLERYDKTILRRLIQLMASNFETFTTCSVKALSERHDIEIAWLSDICSELASKAHTEGDTAEAGSLFKLCATFLGKKSYLEDWALSRQAVASENALVYAIEAVSQGFLVDVDEFLSYVEAFQTSSARREVEPEACRLALQAEFFVAYLSNDTPGQLRLILELTKRADAPAFSFDYQRILHCLKERSGSNYALMKKALLHAIIKTSKLDYCMVLYAYSQLNNLLETDSEKMQLVSTVLEYMHIIPPSGISARLENHIWWFVCTAWNRGLQLKQLGQSSSAKEYFRMSIQMIQKVSVYADEYESRMLSVMSTGET